MKTRQMMTLWAALLAVILMLAACGPALTEEEAAQLTREAASAETGEGEAEEGGEAAAEGEAEAAEAEVDSMIISSEALGPLTETESGLQYYETVEGTGRMPEEGDIVTMHIMGTLEDGTPIADTYSDGQPIVATVSDDDLFAGWKEGLLMMKEGGRARLVIPPALAFGEEGIGGVIPANATITLDVELISAIAPPEPTALDEADFTTTDSGLKYYDITAGSGDTPVAGQDVVVQYTAWLQDGNQFIASSDAQGQPLTFTLGSEQGVFPGWDEGVSTMQVGGKRQLIIPPDLALGEAGGGRIPPNSTLIMEVELVDVLPLVLPTEVSESDFTETESGLKYYDIIEGDGPTPEEGQLVTVNYTGWLEDGTKFDSSFDRGIPFTFVLGSGEVIDGWDEGVATMRVGGTRQLVIPADLGYGDAGAGGTIPPGATLIFEVELLGAEDQSTP